jgi:hypothetical protein
MYAVPTDVNINVEVKSTLIIRTLNAGEPGVFIEPSFNQYKSTLHHKHFETAINPKIHFAMLPQYLIQTISPNRNYLMPDPEPAPVN